MGSVKVNYLSYRYRADKSTIFGMRGLWAFLNSVAVEIITFLPKKVAIFFFLWLSFKYFNLAPLSRIDS